MIDWVNVLLPFEHTERIHGGACMHYDDNGEWKRTTLKKMEQRGSYDCSVAIQSSTDPKHCIDGKFTHIWVSGSPKPVQGHNLFGTDSPLELAAMLGVLALSKAKVIAEADTFTPRRLVRQWLTGKDVTFTIIDITQMMDVGTDTDAAQFIESASNQASMKFRARGGQLTGGTFYIGKNSRRWCLKFYQKLPEITGKSKKHRLPEDIPERDALIDYARGTVRAELRLLSMELKKLGLHKGEAWATRDSTEVWRAYMERVELSGNVRLHTSVVEKLPRRLRSTYALWSQGLVLCPGRGKKGVLSQSVYYEHRKALREYGVDISKPKVSAGEVLPMIRVIEARPKSIPSWAFNTPLLARAA